MRAADAAAIEAGTPGLELMERAARGLADAVDRAKPEGLVVVVCGKGNNGGDGFAAARLLRRRGRDVRLLATAPIDELQGDARVNAERAGAVEDWPGEGLAGAAVVVDCLLGTGFAGAPRGVVAEAIAAINDRDATVVAADVPSGVDASTGVVEGDAVRADVTATFAQPKPGLFIHPGKAHAGRIGVVPIGVEADATIGLVTDAVLDALTRRGASSTKFSSGHVLVAGGSRGLTGAPSLTAQGAARAGAGYVTALVPASLEVIFEIKLTEVMTRALPDEGGAHIAEGVDAVLAAAERGGTLVLGPGLGRARATQEFARAVAARAPVAVVVDADGLNAHAGHLGDLASRRTPTVLTPHAGELARLLDVPSDVVNARRLEHAQDAADRAQAIVVLKGDDTIVAEPGGRVAVSPGGAPGLATAGTGDVLSGVIAAFLEAALDPFHAACAGVFAHLRAGRIAAAPHGPDGVIASDVVAALPAAIAK
jgi:NAD(P)H-hydrate epimerase